MPRPLSVAQCKRTPRTVQLMNGSHQLRGMLQQGWTACPKYIMWGSMTLWG